MSINFLTNEADLKAAFDKVSNSETGQEWAIFEYESSNSSIVRVGETGDRGGLQELVQALDPGRVQYGFGTIACPGLKQRKVVLIHWQGACIPVTRLANSASHVAYVKDFVRKVNLTVFARSEEDIDLDGIQHEISKNTATNNNNQSGYKMFEIPAPVGSAYTPVKPHTDIDLQERERFWREQQEEEQERRRDELKKNEEKAKLFQMQRKQLETELHKTHLNTVASKAPAPPPSHQFQQPQQKKGALVTGRTQMFEQREKELADAKPSTKPKNFKYEVAVTKPLGTPVNRENNNFFQAQNGAETPQTSEAPAMKASEIARQFNGGPVHPPTVNTTAAVRTPLVDCPPPQMFAEPPKTPAKGLQVTALWDYQANEGNEISFNPEDVISEVEKLHDGWWKGKAPNGQVGLFPSNFVREL